jgi:hypothetical protein
VTEVRVSLAPHREAESTLDARPRASARWLPPRADSGETASSAALPRDGDTASRVRLVLLALPSLLTGASLLSVQSPSLAQVWARHLECARHYKRWYFRWPRYCWGVLHVSVTVLARVAEWVTSSPPLFLTAAAVAAAFWLFS